MMKKQIGIFLLTAGMLAGLVGCGGNATDAQEVSQEETEQAEYVSKQEEAEEKSIHLLSCRQLPLSKQRRIMYLLPL